MSWNASSVKRQPLWQATHPALPTKSLRPAISSGSRAASSPFTQQSKRVSGETSVRSKLASAARMLASVARGSSGKAASNRRTLAGSAARRAAALAMSPPPISRGFSIGPLTCASSVGARPSQKKVRPQARFHRDGVRRGSGSPSLLGGGSTPAENDRAGSWHVAQAISPAPERRGSLKRLRPRSTFSVVTGLPAGVGMACGRAKAARQAAASKGSAERPSMAGRRRAAKNAAAPMHRSRRAWWPDIFPPGAPALLAVIPRRSGGSKPSCSWRLGLRRSLSSSRQAGPARPSRTDEACRAPSLFEPPQLQLDLGYVGQNLPVCLHGLLGRDGVRPRLFQRIEAVLCGFDGLGVLLLEIVGDAVEEPFGLPDEAARVLVLDRLGDAPVLDRLLVFVGRGAQQFEPGIDGEGGPVLLLGAHALVGGGEPLLQRCEGRAVGGLVLGFHGLRQRLHRRLERGDIVGSEVVADLGVDFFRRVQEMRQRLRPAARAHQFVADKEMAADQFDVAVEAQGRRQLGVVVLLRRAALIPFPTLAARPGDVNGPVAARPLRDPERGA